MGVLALALLSCQSAMQGEMSADTIDTVHIDLRMREESSAPYLPIQNLTVPEHHKIHDGMFPYEGIGWENEYIGYRLYLDERSAVDIFGKITPDPVLSKIDEKSPSYHDPAPWGMDILHVGPSRGIGGLGRFQDGKPVQLGPVESMTVKIHKPAGHAPGFTILYSGISAERAKANLKVRYMMDDKSPMTHVYAQTSGGTLPMTSGIVSHKDGKFFKSDTAPWRYIASYGPQSQSKDNLGLALFFKAEQATFQGTENETHFIAFRETNVTYKFLGAWEKDALGTSTQKTFEAYLDSTLERLNAAQ